jgi:hypothetical protein
VGTVRGTLLEIRGRDVSGSWYGGKKVDHVHLFCIALGRAWSTKL